MNEIQVFRTKINDIVDKDLDELLSLWIQGSDLKIIHTPNCEMILEARKKPWFKKVLNDCDLALPDSVSLRFATAALTDQNLDNRHTGVDTLIKLAEICNREGKKLVLFGSANEIGKVAVKNLKLEFSNLNVVSIDPGLIHQNSDGDLKVDDLIIEKLENSNPDVLAIALGHGKQEKFISDFCPKSVKIAIGVGGAVDMIANKLPRAPRFIRKIGFEWLWRVLIQPSRIGRIYNASIVFPVVVIRETIRQKRLFKALKSTAPEVFKQIIGK